MMPALSIGAGRFPRLLFEGAIFAAFRRPPRASMMHARPMPAKAGRMARCERRCQPAKISAH